MTLQLSGVILNFNWASESPVTSLSSHASVISRCATSRGRSPGVIGPANTGAAMPIASANVGRNMFMPAP